MIFLLIVLKETKEWFFNQEPVDMFVLLFLLSMLITILNLAFVVHLK